MGLYDIGPTGIRKRRSAFQKRSKTSTLTFTFAADEIHQENSTANFARISEDGRRKYREEVAIAPPSPEKHLDYIPECSTGNQMEEFQHVDLLEVQVENEDAVKPRARRYVSSVSSHGALFLFGV